MFYDLNLLKRLSSDYFQRPSKRIPLLHYSQVGRSEKSFTYFVKRLY